MRPHGLGHALLGRLEDSDSAATALHPSQKLIRSLAMAVDRDDHLQFTRESSALLMRLWERRIETVDFPDPGELEALVDLDPCLATARDLLEQPERYDAILAGGTASHHD